MLTGWPLRILPVAPTIGTEPKTLPGGLPLTAATATTVKSSSSTGLVRKQRSGSSRTLTARVDRPRASSS